MKKLKPKECFKVHYQRSHDQLVGGMQKDRQVTELGREDLRLDGPTQYWLGCVSGRLINIWTFLIAEILDVLNPNRFCSMSKLSEQYKLNIPVVRENTPGHICINPFQPSVSECLGLTSTTGSPTLFMELPDPVEKYLERGHRFEESLCFKILKKP